GRFDRRRRDLPCFASTGTLGDRHIRATSPGRAADPGRRSSCSPRLDRGRRRLERQAGARLLSTRGAAAARRSPHLSGIRGCGPWYRGGGSRGSERRGHRRWPGPGNVARKTCQLSPNQSGCGSRGLDPGGGRADFVTGQDSRLQYRRCRVLENPSPLPSPTRGEGVFEAFDLTLSPRAGERRREGRYANTILPLSSLFSLIAVAGWKRARPLACLQARPCTSRSAAARQLSFEGIRSPPLDDFAAFRPAAIPFLPIGRSAGIRIDGPVLAFLIRSP